MLLQLQPIVLWHRFVERFQVQHYLKRHSNLKSYSNTHSFQLQWNTKLPAVFAKFYTMHVYVFSHVCKKNRTVQLYIYQYTYSQSILFTFIWSASLFKCFSLIDQSRMEVAKAFKLYTLNVANFITLLNEIQYTTRDSRRIDPWIININSYRKLFT